MLIKLLIVVKNAIGKIISLNKGADTKYISVPAKLASDSAFPFLLGERVDIELSSKDSIIIRKVLSDNNENVSE